MRNVERSWAWESMQRYLPAEVAGIAVSVAAGLVLTGLTGSMAAAALGATWGENAGYYGVIATRDLMTHRHRAARPVLATVGGLLVEFGPAEVLDSLVFRPLLMFAGLRLASNPALGIVAGKLAADLLFYAVTIPSRQLLVRRRHLPTGGHP